MKKLLLLFVFLPTLLLGQPVIKMGPSDTIQGLPTGNTVIKIKIK